MTKTRFRAVVALSIALGFLGGIASLFFESTLPPPLREYLEREQNAEVTAMDFVLLLIWIPLLVAIIASYVGMLRFARWSRPLALATSALGVLALPLFGPTVEPGIVTAWLHLSSMVYGAVLAVAYCSPTVATWFGDLPPDRPLPPPA